MKPLILSTLVLLAGCIQAGSDRTYSDMEWLSGTISLEKVLINYRIEGKGVPCLIIGSARYYPKTFSEELRNHLKMYFVDLPWFAEDSIQLEPGTYTIDSLSKDIESIRKALKLEEFIIIGHSIHGSIAMEYTKRYPEIVTHCIMIGSPCIYNNEKYDKATEDIWKTADVVRRELQDKNWQDYHKFSRGERHPVVANYLAMAPKYWYDPMYDASWLWEGIIIQTEIIRHLYDSIFFNYQMFPNGMEAPVPSLAIIGKYDYIIPYFLWEDMDTIPNLTVELFMKSGHTPQLEEPDFFNSTIIEWLNDFSSKPNQKDIP